MKKTILMASLFALLSTIIVSGAPAAAPIKIGVLLPLTGRDATFGHIQKNAVLMAAAEINDHGGIKDRNIDLVLADTQGNPDGGRAAIRKLIQRDNVLVIGGGFSSSATWATGAIAQQNSIPFVVTSATADKITEQGWDYVFRLNQPLSEHLEALASFLSTVATNIKSVAIVHDHSLSSSAAARRFFKRSEVLGLTLVIRERYEAAADDLAKMLTRVKARNPDCIYAVADNTASAALLARQIAAQELKPKLFVGAGNGYSQPGFAAQAGKASNYVVSTALWTPLVPYLGAGAFNQNFMDLHSFPPGHLGAEAYAGIMVIADALGRARQLTPSAVRDALARTNMMTLLGPVKFVAYNQKSRQNRLPAFLVQWINGKQEIIWPEKFATLKAVYPAPQFSEDRCRKSEVRSQMKKLQDDGSDYPLTSVFCHLSSDFCLLRDATDLF